MKAQWGQGPETWHQGGFEGSPLLSLLEPPVNPTLTSPCIVHLQSDGALCYKQTWVHIRVFATSVHEPG